MGAAVVERDVGRGGQVGCGLGDEYLSGCGEIADSFGDVHDETHHIVGSKLDLAGMDARTNLQPESACSGNDLVCRSQRARGRVESGEEAVTDRFDLAPSIAPQRRSAERTIAS